LASASALASIGSLPRLAFAQVQAAPAAAPPAGSESAPRKHRQPPPAVIPLAETQAADELFRAGNFTAAVAQSKAALNKNERYTPAMLVMAKAYYKLH
jgi:Tfp pilus assembly protein PilF